MLLISDHSVSKINNVEFSLALALPNQKHASLIRNEEKKNELIVLSSILILKLSIISVQYEL